MLTQTVTTVWRTELGTTLLIGLFSTTATSAYFRYLSIHQSASTSGATPSSSPVWPRAGGHLAFKEHAQNGRGFERPAPRASVFLSSLAARSRALCACWDRQSRLRTPRFSSTARSSDPRSSLCLIGKLLLPPTAGFVADIHLRLWQRTTYPHQSQRRLEKAC